MKEGSERGERREGRGERGRGWGDKNDLKKKKGSQLDCNTDEKEESDEMRIKLIFFKKKLKL